MEKNTHRIESNSWFYRKLESLNNIIILETRKFKPPGDYNRPENCVRILTKQKEAVDNWNEVQADKIV